MIQEFEALSRLNEDRIRKYPDQSLFEYAKRDIEKIREVLAGGGMFTMEFYERLNIGVMCARELEAVDPEYCNTVYAMLEKVRLEANGH